jgi:outer membrane protein assembly factor BamB
VRKHSIILISFVEYSHVGEFLRLRARVLFVLLMILLMQVALATPLANAQARSQQEIILSTPTNDVAMDMVIDSIDSVIVVGRSETSADPSRGMFYIVKISPSGETLWTKLWNETPSDILTGVAVDSADNILVIGACNLTTDHVYGVIYKFNPDGDKIWEIELGNLNFVWSQTYFTSYCLDIQILPASGDFFVVGSVGLDLYNISITRYNSSGSQEWQSEWHGPSEYYGCIASYFWLSSNSWIIVSGLLRDDPDSYYPLFSIPCLVAFDFNGQQVWNRTTGELSAGFEYNSNEYITATYAGRYMDHIVRQTYEMNETWNFDMLIDDRHSVIVTGFLANSTNNLIGYGEVTSNIAGQAVIKSFRPAYEAPQPPQTLIFSFSADGEFLWYDYLVLGRLSSPCGCQFDSDGRLIVAGYTSPWAFETCDFYVVFGFVQTPFPSHYDSFAVLVFPIINLIALSSAWGFERVRKRRVGQAALSPPRSTLRSVAAAFLLGELLLYGALWQYFIGPFAGGGGPPPLLVYYPSWVAYLLSGLLYSIAIPAIVCLMIWHRRPRTKS